MAATDATRGSDAGPVRVRAILGHVADDAWRGRLRRARVDMLLLDQAEAQKSRLRKITEAGVDVAISLDRATPLRDGDILLWDEADGSALVAHVEFQDVLIIDLAALRNEPRGVSMARCVELGHALGNQHWPAVLKGDRVYVPLTVAKPVMTSVMKTHAFEGVTYAFAPGTEIIPYLAPHEARRLFGVAEGHRHGAVPGEVPS